MRGTIRTTSVVLWAVLFGLAGYYAYLRYSTPVPCAEPVTYRIGALDPRFGLATSTFIADIAAASTIWDNALSKQLFAYDPHGEVTINLVYDNRQAATQQEQKISSDITSTTAVADSVKTKYQSLTTQYNIALNTYNKDLDFFNKAQDAYNNSVVYWNNHGGAPRTEYEALSAERNSLQSRRDSLEVERQKVNNLADQINALIDKYNLLVDHINTQVSSFNNDGLVGTEFEEGVYVREGSTQYINVYQFGNKTFFIRVIAHELGHALGLDHNNNPDSIMNPVNTSQSLTTSPDDLADLRKVCDIHNT